MTSQNPLGQIGWIDLTVENADEIRDFYQQVTGWSHSPVDMGDYQDYCMNPAGMDQPVAGICHRRGSNANMPPQWIIYINVDNLDASLQKCQSLGGKVVAAKRSVAGQGTMAVIQDPSGAVAALFESA